MAVHHKIYNSMVIVLLLSCSESDHQVQGYAKYLKSLYKAKLQAAGSREQWPPLPTNIIFRLAMIKSEEKLRREPIDNELVRQKTITGKVEEVLAQRKIEIKLEEIFKDIKDDHQKKVLIEGPPGCGKSTLSLHICQRWAREELFQEYKLVILVKLRDETIKNAQRVSDLLPRINDSMGHNIEMEITTTSGKGILFVLDGWDELPTSAMGYSIVLSLIERKQLSESSVIITSRPTSSAILQSWVFSRIEILGFTKDELRKFFLSCLNDDAKVVDSLLHRININPVIEGNCYLPLNASILVHLFKCGNNVLPTTQYGIFSDVICNCILRDIKKTSLNSKIRAISSLDNLPPGIDSQFEHLCEIAYRGVMDDQVIFNLGAHFNTLGLLQGVESFTCYGTSHTFNFLHLSVQEVLAARHIAKKLGESEQTELFKRMLDNPRFTAVFQYFAAITKLQTQGISEVVVQVANSTNKAHLLSLLHCLYEAQDSSLCDMVAQQLDSVLDLEDMSLSPADCFSIGYFLTFTKDFKLYLRRCSIDDHRCKALFRADQVYNLRVLK